VGVKFAIGATLEDQNNSKFVRAILTDADNNPLPFSPLGLPNRGNGLYLDNTRIYPDTDFVVAIYEVYDDGLYTQRSSRYKTISESFEREVQQVDAIDHQKIISDINTHVTEEVNKLVRTDVEAVVFQNQEISVTIEQNEVIVVIEDIELSAQANVDDSISAEVESGEVTVKIAEDDLDVLVGCLREGVP